MAKDKSENTAFRAKMQELASQYDSNQAFADKLGISRQTLGFWLHNDPKKRRSPDMDGLIKVSKALNMSIDYLVGLSESNSLDADIQAVSKYTGLSEKAINAMNDDRFQAEMGNFLNEFAEHPLFNKFATAFANTYFLASEVTKTNKDERLQEVIDFPTRSSFVLITEKTIVEKMHELCDGMCGYLNEYARFYFDRMAEISSNIIVETIEPEEIIPAEVQNDSEVK